MKYTFSILVSFVFSSILNAQVNKKITLDSAGTLYKSFNTIDKNTISKLTVEGPIDASDFAFLRDSLPQLLELNLSEAIIKSYSLPQNSKRFSHCSPSDSNIIPSNAFSQIPSRSTNHIRSIILPNSTSIIGYRAFFSCNFLQSVKIPSTVTIIGENSFSNCDTLTTIIIPDFVKTISKQAFANCKMLSEIFIPKSVTYISPDAFLNCNIEITVDSENLNYSSLDGVLYSKNKDTLYHVSPQTTSFIIPQFVKCIGSFAFTNCKNLLTINIPSSVISIDQSAFQFCTSLSNVNISSSVISIGQNAFWACNNLKSIFIPNSVLNIGSGAFRFCYNLSSVTLPQNITILNKDMFLDCNNLKTITIPASVSRIDMPFFDDSILVDIKNKYYVINNGCLYSKKQDTLFHIPCSKYGDFQLTSGVKYISKDVFSRRINITSIEIPSTILSLPSNLTCSINVDKNNPQYSSIDGVLFNKTQDTLLRYPINLKGNYIIPSSVKTIGNKAFENCKFLLSVTFPSSVSTIEESAFSKCKSLQLIKIPSSIYRIKHLAFWGCKNISSIYAYSEFPLKIDNSVFREVDKSKCVLYIPNKTKNVYTEAKEWKDFKNIIDTLTLNHNERNYKTGIDTLPLIHHNQNLKYIPDNILREIFKKKGFLTNDSLDLKKISDIDYLEIMLTSSSDQKAINLESLQYFTSLNILKIYGATINVLNIFPPNITMLYCSNNSISKIENLPITLTDLDCENNNITKLDNLPPRLHSLNCSNNKITSLDKLPLTVDFLLCENNLLTSLDKLPSNLYRLACSNNKITRLDKLPANIIRLYCSHNQLSELKYLPVKLEYIDCSFNNINKIYNLPSNISEINISHNKIDNIDNLSDSIKQIDCSFNNISNLQKLPNALENLTISNNALTRIPSLPNSIKSFNYYNNPIPFDSLPENYKRVTCNNDYCNCLPIEDQKWKILNVQNGNLFEQITRMKITLSSSYSWGFGSQIETINLTQKDSSLFADHYDVNYKKGARGTDSIYSVKGIFRIDTNQLIQIIKDISLKNTSFVIKTDSTNYKFDLKKMKYSNNGILGSCMDCTYSGLVIEIFSKSNILKLQYGFDSSFGDVFSSSSIDFQTVIDWLYLYRLLQPTMENHETLNYFFNKEKLELIKKYMTQP